MAVFTVINLNDAGDGSLRQAILDANDSPQRDDIDFDAAVIGTIHLTSGELAITDSLTVNGPGPGVVTIDAQGQSRVFNIDDGTSSVHDVEIGGLTITGGREFARGGGILSRENLSVTNSTISGNSVSGIGGGIYAVGDVTVANSTISGNGSESNGGGIFSPGNVSVTNSTISGNGSGRGNGGGIYAVGDVMVIDSTISGNAANQGGGIYADNVTITDSTISGNTAFDGGGIYADCGVTVTDSTISGNTAGDGGGIRAECEVTLTGSVISGNTASSDNGGGIYVWSDDDVAVTLTNSTISGNSAAGKGGGIHAYSRDEFVAVTITSSTISGNTARSGGGISIDSDDGASAMTVTGSVLSGNTVSDDVPGDLAVSGVFGSVASYSLIGLAAAAQVGNGGGNIIDDSPRLAPLANNGGPTQTHALLSGSPAIDAGDPDAVAGDDDVPLFDQRGAPFARVVSGRIDIGAYEFGTSNPADLTGNGFVDFEDLTVLLAAWNQNVSAAEGNLVEADTTPVNFEDLTVLLAAWTGPGPAGAPVGRRLAAAIETSTSDRSGFKSDSEPEAPRQAAAYGSATGVASYRRTHRPSHRIEPDTRLPLRRLQATATDLAMADYQVVAVARRDMLRARRSRVE